MRYDYGYFEEDHLGQVTEIHLWRRILRYVAPYWIEVAGAVLLSLTITAASLALPYIVRLSIDDYIINQELLVAERLSGLIRMTTIFIGLIGLEFVTAFFQVILLEWTGQRIMHRLRQELFAHLLSLELSFFNKNPVGKLVTRLTNDIQNMHEMFTSVIVTIFNDLIRLAGILAVLFWMNARLALVMCLLIPVMLISVWVFSKMARDAFRAIRTQLARINSYLQEALSGVGIIQLFLRERDSVDDFRKLNQEYLNKSMHQIKIFGIFMPMIEVMSSVAVALIIWYGGGQIIQGAMTLGVLVAFISYMRLFFQPMRELSQKYSIVQSAMASAERIFQLLDTRAGLTQKTDGERPVAAQGRITFENVSFAYKKDLPILQDFNLEVTAGETVAIVGATGAGKTTVINLLERFYDPTAGRILFDGHDLRDLDNDWLRQQIGLVMQEVYMIPASIKDNILLGGIHAEKRLDSIIADAQLDDVINNLPQGMDTMVGEGGMELSAGQRQLLAFARVLARDPKVLVLDEATSNVDTETEKRIEQALTRTMAGRTSIIIAHRLSTIQRADRIIVMAAGEIIEQGNHETLMQQQGLYYQLQTMQNGECLFAENNMVEQDISENT